MERFCPRCRPRCCFGQLENWNVHKLFVQFCISWVCQKRCVSVCERRCVSQGMGECVWESVCVCVCEKEKVWERKKVTVIAVPIFRLKKWPLIILCGLKTTSPPFPQLVVQLTMCHCLSNRCSTNYLLCDWIKAKDNEFTHASVLSKAQFNFGEQWSFCLRLSTIEPKVRIPIGRRDTSTHFKEHPSYLQALGLL